MICRPDPPDELIDSFGRRIRYLRVSVTDRCNLRCSYCMPTGPDRWEPLGKHLSAVEIERVLAVAAGLGVERVRLTGGEPLTRPDIVEIAGRIARIPGITDLSLTTNGVSLDRLAGPLRRAGLHRVNVSLDSLDPRVFAGITGRDRHRQVLAGIEAAVACGLEPVKLNIVALKGINGNEILDFVSYGIEKGVILRFIEKMPMGMADAWRPDHYLSCEDIRREIDKRYPLESLAENHGCGPARLYRVRGTGTEIGFITPMSDSFCAECNRMRITADGFVRPCLSPCDELDLRSPLRGGGGDEEITRVFRRAMAIKPERHDFQWDTPVRMLRTMSRIGG